MTKTDKQIVDFIKAQGKTTRRIMCAAVSVKTGRKVNTLRNRLVDLVKSGKVINLGHGRSSRYMVEEKTLPIFEQYNRGREVLIY